MKPSETLIRAEAQAKREALELAMLQQLRAAKLDAGMHREYRFDPHRRWRADFAWPKANLLLEVEGGTWAGGRHTTGKGFEADAEKYAAAVLANWRVLRVTGLAVKSGVALQWVAKALGAQP